MKTAVGQPKVIAKVGTVSVREARAAARIAKSQHADVLVVGSARDHGLWERYLGHFGSVTRSVAVGGAKAKVAKKATARKAVAVGKKRSARTASAKKQAAKKR
ncbi:MAG: hypothetical protein MUE41_11460 [Gemmatimonadaceae bacterium]|nr:hypothetical protein [Gemmatimonadaceae bacterium]